MMHPSTAEMPLTGVRVIDLGQYIAAPGAGQNLADLGADVIKVEPPTGDQARSVGVFGQAMVRANNRGKRSIALDLRTSEGARVMRDLTDGADVVIHNFRHGASARLGLDATTLRSNNERLVYGFITGFGSRGPSAERVGLDIAAQAEFGIMGMTGEPDGEPQRVGFTVADVLAAQALTSGLLAALLRRGLTGEGSVVETSLMEALVQAQGATWTEYGLTGVAPVRRGNGQALAAPAADVIRTRDGGWIVLSAYVPEKFLTLCRTIGSPEIADDSRFRTNADRVENRADLLKILEDALGCLDQRPALDLLQSAGIVCGAVRRFDQIAEDEDLQAAGLIVSAAGARDSYTAPGLPFTLNGVRTQASTTAPDVGEHTRQVLRELGRSDREIDRLDDTGVVVSS